MWISINRDWTVKPPLGTPLRSDGHWSVQGLVGAFAFNEGAGGALFNAVDNSIGSKGNNNNWSADMLSRGGNGYGGSSLPCKTNQLKSTYIVKSIATQANGNGFNYIQGLGYRKKAILLNNDLSIALQTHTDWGTISFSSPTNVVSFGKPISLGISLNIVGGDYHGVIVVDGVCVLDQHTAWGGTLDDEAGNGYHVGEDSEIGWGLYGAVFYSLIYNIILPPSQIASLSANPWQIYEPEVVWIEVPDGAGGTAYSDDLTALAESYASVTEVATYVDAATVLITAGVDATSAITMTEAVLATAQAADTVSDMAQRVESLLTTVQAADSVATAVAAVESLIASAASADTVSDSVSSGSNENVVTSASAVTTVADVQAMGEQLLAAANVQVTVADGVSTAGTENVTTSATSSATVQDVVAMLDSVLVQISAQATATETLVSATAENLLSSATAITGVSDLQLMVDNVTIMAQSGVAIGEIGSYLESVGSAATSGASVADTIIGAMQKLFPLTVAGRDPLALSVLWRDPLTLNIAVST